MGSADEVRKMSGKRLLGFSCRMTIYPGSFECTTRNHVRTYEFDFANTYRQVAALFPQTKDSLKSGFELETPVSLLVVILHYLLSCIDTF